MRGKLLRLARLSSIAVPAQVARKERHCSWKGATETTVTEAEEALEPRSAERNAAMAGHLPWGTPGDPSNVDNERPLVSEHCTINHDADLLAAGWTVHRPRAATLARRRRHDAFCSDPRRSDSRPDAKERGHGADYKEPKFDQGHFGANSDMGRSENAMLNTYVMRNVRRVSVVRPDTRSALLEQAHRCQTQGRLKCRGS